MDLIESYYRSQKFGRCVRNIFDSLVVEDNRHILIAAPNIEWVNRAVRAVVNMCVGDGKDIVYESADYYHFDNGSILTCRAVGTVVIED